MSQSSVPSGVTTESRLQVRSQEVHGNEIGGLGVLANKVDALHSSFVAYYLVHCFQHSNDEAYLSNVLLNHRS